MTQPTRDVVPETAVPRVAVETNGIDVIAEEERRGRPAQLFWPWFGSNVSVFGLAYGSFLLGFGISFWQAVLPAADAGVPVRVGTDACAGSTQEDHDRALRLMSLYEPIVRLTTTNEVLRG